MPNQPRVLQSSTEVNPVQLSYVEYLFRQEQAHQDKISQFRRYYEGDHDTQLTDRMSAFLEMEAEDEFNLNLCAIVVDTPAERLSVTGFDADDETKETQPAEELTGEGETEALTQSEQVWDWWQLNDLDREQLEIYKAAGKDSESYIMVSWKDGTDYPIFTFEEACASGEGVKLHYIPGTRKEVDFASKRWLIDLGPDAGKMRRMNLYYPDRIEKYFSRDDAETGNWQKYIDPNEPNGQVWPLPWVNKQGEPLGVPIFQFDIGRSDLADAVPIQNAVNKSIIDLYATADVSAFPMLTAIGVDPSALAVGPGAWIYSDDKEAQFGSIPGSDLSPMADIVDRGNIWMARVTRTPLTAFQMAGGGMNRIAEGTLQQLEAGLIAKVEGRQISFGGTWENAFKMGRKLYNVFGDGGMDEEQPIKALWKEAQTRNEEQLLATLEAKRRLGVPLVKLWQEAGYDADEIEEMKMTEEYQAHLAGLNMTMTDSQNLELADAA